MTLEDVLRQGFAAAHRRFGLIFLDILWKGIWFVATVGALVAIATWFRSDLRSALGSLALLSLFGWLFLEALFRAWMLDQRETRVFFVSGATKTTVLTVLAVILIPVWRGGAPALAVVIFSSIAFALTLIDTLIRANAVELLGTDLIRVTGLVGILMSFEILIAGSVAVAVAAGFLSVARLADAMTMLAVAAVAIAFLTLLHSYLLLVRFSAVDIMRRNVIEV